MASLSTGLANAVQYDNAAHDSVTFGNAGTPVRLHNVEDGVVAADSKDAVNGGQLYNLSSSVSTGMTSLSTNIDGISTSVTSLSTSVDSISTGMTSLSTGVANSVQYDDANHTSVRLGDTGAAPVKLTNVADGEVAAGSNEAVNGGQLFTLSTSVSTSMTSLSTGIANAVQYDDGDHKTVTLGNVGTPVKIKNVDAGEVSADSLEAVNGSQLYKTASSTADALGGGSTVNQDGTITKPTYTFQDGNTFNNVGDALTNLDGRVTQNTTDISTINETLNNINTGGGIKYFHANSVLEDSQATGAESVAIGGNAQAIANNSVALGSNSLADRANTVSVGSKGAERQITNVAAGTQDTDAVNVSQLKGAGLINGDGTTNTSVTYDHNADGSTNYSSITLGNNVAGGTTIHNVAAGVASDDAVNVDQMNAAIDRVTNIAMSGGNPMFAAQGDVNTEVASATGVHSVAMGANASATADNSVALGANSVADRVNTVSVGSAGNERQITNVAAGTQSTDAVNVSQLNLASTQAQNYTDSRIAGVQGQINNMAKAAYGGIAAAMASAGLPQPTAPGKTMVALAGARYAGASGAALGISHVTQDESWVIKASGNTSSSGNVGFTIGAGHQW